MCTRRKKATVTSVFKSFLNCSSEISLSELRVHAAKC